MSAPKGDTTVMIERVGKRMETVSMKTILGYALQTIGGLILAYCLWRVQEDYRARVEMHRLVIDIDKRVNNIETTRYTRQDATVMQEKLDAKLNALSSDMAVVKSKSEDMKDDIKDLSQQMTRALDRMEQKQ